MGRDVPGIPPGTGRCHIRPGCSPGAVDRQMRNEGPAPPAPFSCATSLLCHVSWSRAPGRFGPLEPHRARLTPTGVAGPGSPHPITVGVRAGTGRLTAGWPAQAKRSGRSAARLIPTRGPIVSGAASTAARMLSRPAGSQRSRPLSARVRPSPLPRLPGPRSSAAAGGPGRAPPRRARTAGSPRSHRRGAQQDGAGPPLRLADDVGAEVHPVGEVDVEMPGRPEHHGGPRCRPPVGMGGGVLQP